MRWRTPTSSPSPGARSERFSKTIETGRWWKGAPESLKVMIVEEKGTLLLGLAKMNRRAQGHTATSGKKKPHRYQQATRVFFYNLGDIEHVWALLHTFRHLAAYAAGLKENQQDRRYTLELGQRRTLSRAALQLASDAADPDVKYDGVEVLDLRCTNGNYRNPNNKVFALDPDIREKAESRWRAACSHRPQYTFHIRRVLTSAEDELRAFTLNDASEITIPLEAAGAVVDALRYVAQYVWSYIVRHPDQAHERQEGARQRRQLHKLQPVDKVLIPRLDECLTFKPEHALFQDSELYERTIPRYQAGSWGGFHPLYLRRLCAYSAGELRWGAHWLTSEWEAQEDVAAVERRLATALLLRVRAIFRVLVLTLTLKQKRRHSARRVYPRCLRARRPVTQRRKVELRARGPPARPP